jgi:putative alpha-1,2-mannosidase
MGLFEMQGGCEVRPSYDLSSPLFDRVVIHLDKNYYSGKTFTIEAQQNSANNIYIQSATLNGRPLTEARLFHDELVKDGQLIFQMGSQPNENWGRNISLSPETSK